MKKYIGTKKREGLSFGNEGQIWVELLDKTYQLQNTDRVLPESSILHDLSLGYLKELKDEKPKDDTNRSETT